MRTTGNFAVLAVVGWLLMHGSTAADENPWMVIREQAIALAKEAQAGWKGDGPLDSTALARFLELAKSKGLPLSSEEITRLVDHAPLILRPDQDPRDETEEDQYRRLGRDPAATRRRGGTTRVSISLATGRRILGESPFNKAGS